MNGEIESAIKSYLAAYLTALGEDFASVSCHAGTSRDTLPGDRQTVVAAVRNNPRLPVRKLLYQSELTCVITTPVIEGMLEADHNALVNVVLWALQPRLDDDHDATAVAAAQAALDAAMVDATIQALHCPSTWAEGPQSAHTEKDWQTLISVKLLVTEN